MPCPHLMRPLCWTLLMLAMVTGVLPVRANTGPAGQASDGEQIARQLVSELIRTPAIGPRDVHKFLHQVALGPAHWPDAWGARAYLWREIHALQTMPRLAPIPALFDSTGGPFVRVHLEPFLRRGGHPDSLLVAFQRSANTAPDSALFHASMNELRRLLRGDARPNTLAFSDSLLALQARLENAGWPSLSHSAGYAVRYQPHYRVLSRQEADALVQALPAGSAE